MPTAARPIAVFHEHPDWFRPLFLELERREIPYVRLGAASHQFDPSESEVPYSLVVNRASPSAYLRAHGQTTFYTLHWLKHLERVGVPVVNGSHVYGIEISKATQLDLLTDLGLPYPRAVVINDASQAPSAARGLRFPVLVKANVGGSGAGIVRYDTPETLQAEVDAGRVALGVDGTALVQESAPLRGGHITRVETLGGKFLYAINVYPAVGSFDLCPADACQTTTGVELVGGACAVDAPKTGLKVEGATPPAEIIAQAERIAQAAQLDVGGIEYLVDDRDGKHYFYDINALSNFVADPVNVVGFDPWSVFVDYLDARRQGTGKEQSRESGTGNRESNASEAVSIPDSRLPIPQFAEAN
jgi:glutathione synthase/RimK-type ligase-like ATP-grasp enzyme